MKPGQKSPSAMTEALSLIDHKSLLLEAQSSAVGICQCEDRIQDEEEKENMMAEIHLTYEEILQLEQALIELDEQNTTNTLEIRKREAKMIFILKQMEEIDDILASKENGSGEDPLSSAQIAHYKDQNNML